MSGGDFRSNEVSATLDKAATAKIVLTTDAGEEIVLKDGLSYPAGTVVDATYMSAAALEDFLPKEIEKTKAEGVLFSLHMKATMMKVSDPIIFGHAVKAWLAPVFEKFGDKLDALGVNRQRGPRHAAGEGQGRARDHGRDRGRDGGAPADVHGRQRPRASPTCTCPRTSSSTPRCPRSSGRRQGLGPGWQGT
jgi:hypothetical protein